MLSTNYIQKGLLFPSTSSSTDHLTLALTTTLHAYYLVASHFITDKHPDRGCSVSIDYNGHSVQIVHIVTNVIPLNADVPPHFLPIPRCYQL
ncbi:hypothetical protein E2562_037292 [Oryza meyeriana var. granulata]|uniref:Uncharacterized protein n=1 Tax=Oryza meyeriana var. granulata TaxID=110450 RepID=A0A6G1E7S6_9ORYZ|nr:hypothetical protein E2562_037292 [Oryza meyeriana var. granulata]